MRLLLIFTTLLLLVACSPPGPSIDESLPPGDIERGASLFTQSVSGAPACSTCHTVDGTTSVGPTLAQFSVTASTRVNGLSPEDYTHHSIVRPAAYVVSGFGNSMYPQYAQRLTQQQIADLVAYLLSL